MNPERIRVARAKCGKTLQQVADDMGITPAAVMRYEKGMTNPAAEHIRPLADSLGVGAGWLIDPRPVNIEDDKRIDDGDSGVIQLTVLSTLEQIGLIGDD